MCGISIPLIPFCIVFILSCEVVSIAYPVLIDVSISVVRVSYRSRPSTELAFHLHTHMRGEGCLIDFFHCFIHLAIMYNFFIC